MEKNLEELLEWAKTHKMTPEELEEQKISFAYGNVKLSNPDITKEIVRDVAKKLKG